MAVTASTASGIDIISDSATVTAANVTLLNTGDDAATQTTSVQRNVDFNLAINGAPNPVVAGSGAGNLIYTLTLKNNGPSDASGIQVLNTQSFPSGVTLLNATPGAGTFFNAGTGVWSIANVSSGTSATLTLTDTVDAMTVSGLNVMSDAASVPACNETRINLPDDSASQAVSVTRSADLTVTVVDNQHTVTAGSGAGNLTYIVTVTNNGPSDASGVMLSNAQVLPAGVTLNSVAASAGTSFSGGTGVWTVGTLPLGASATLTLTNTVMSSAANGAAVSNTATVTAANEPLINTGDDTATRTTAIVRSVDLTVTVADAPHVVTAGSGIGNLLYTVTLRNLGPSDATGVQIINAQVLPASVMFVSTSANAGTAFDSLTGTWSVGSLAAGATVTLQLTDTVPSAAAIGTAVISDSATVASVNEPRINLNDDQATQTTSVTRTIDLSVSVQDSPHLVVPGSGAENLVYTVKVSNNGPSDATGVQVLNSQVLPPGVTFDIGNPSAGTAFSPNSGIWNIGNLANGATATLVLTNTVGASAATNPQGVSDTATVQAANENLINTEDDTGSQTTALLRQADLTISVNDSPHTVIAGSSPGNLVYTVTLVNNGPSDTTGVLVLNSQTLPAGVTYDSASATAGAQFDGTSGIWTVGTLPSGAAVTLSLNQTVTAVAAGGTNVIGNTATVTNANEMLLNPNDDAAAQFTSIARNVHLAVSATVAPQIVAASSGAGNLVFSLTVVNTGPSDASGVALTNSQILPPGVTLVNGAPGTGTNFDSATGVWNVGVLSRGASATLTVTDTVDASAAVGTIVVSDVLTVSTASETRPDTSNESATALASVTYLLASGPLALPAVAGVGETVQFNATVGGSALTYSWTFGDGASATGISVAHAYTAPGTYTATFTITGDPSGPVDSVVTVIVKAPLVGTGNDSDGDGFSDNFEIAAGSNPNDPNSTPTNKPAGALTSLTVSKAALELHFAKPGKDTVAFSGSVNIPAGFVASGQQVVVDVGGVAHAFKLDAKGAAKDNFGTFKLNVKSSKGTVAAQSAKYSATFKNGMFAATLADSGLTNADAKDLPVTVVFSTVLNQTIYQSRVTLKYSAMRGKSGSAKK